MTLNIVPPNDHSRNLTEKAVQTWKDHFIGVMSRTTAAFPVRLWFQETTQA